MKFGVFDHIEPVPGLRLDRIYRERLLQIERLDAAGFYAYHLAEHHTPAIHSLAPSQNVFLGAVAQRTRRLRFGPCVYVLPLHHPLRLIEEISMLDNLSDGRLEIGVGRGGVMEAFFWGQEADPETNYARYLETLDIIRTGLSHDELTYAGRFHSFEKLPMYLRPLQRPYPPLWYMRNPVTAARDGMHTIIVGSLDGLAAAVPRYRAAWDEHQGAGVRPIPRVCVFWLRDVSRAGLGLRRPDPGVWGPGPRLQDLRGEPARCALGIRRRAGHVGRRRNTLLRLARAGQAPHQEERGQNRSHRRPYFIGE